MSEYEPHDTPTNQGLDPALWDAFVDDVRGLAQVPGGNLAGEHILAAADTARETPAPAPGRTPSAVPLLRRRTVFTGLFSTILGKILVGTMAVAAATAGVGAAGGLPDPVQGFVDDHVFQREQVRAEDPIQLRLHTNEGSDKVITKQERIRHQLGVETPVGGPTQSQTQTQQGGCEEEPCGTQSQTQTQQGGCEEEPCGTQSQTQTQQGGCEEEPCGTETQTQTQQGGCEEEPCGTETQTQTQQGGCEEEPCGTQSGSAQQGGTESGSAQQGGCEEGACGESGQSEGSSQTQNPGSGQRP